MLQISWRSLTRQTVQEVGPVGTYPLGLARIDAEVGPEWIAGARSWLPVGTRFAIFGFPHSLSLIAKHHAELRSFAKHPVGKPWTDRPPSAG
jgi:hypothetical protein